ncbi:MAG TPA: DNA methyltransferase [Dysgonomonas sp.]|uniref:DNA methyltransferase n=1 Tax=unclassified Dysgonomonas TaxID=2630389 RepID=UPI0025BC6722|nr:MULTISPECIES: DNA methyltransferase [unclassified Dysgonomonas]HML65570.1 DNA methyltransferase [Dysgonomonas sp.]
MEQLSQNIIFDNIPVNPDWCFKNARSTEQWTHGYHRYPAKFLPNLVKKLIEEYTLKEDLVADMFAGCGTTLVEAKIHGRKSVGVDINPVAELITKAKINPINPERLLKRYNAIIKELDQYRPTDYIHLSIHEKIDYWFFPENKAKIAFLYKKILQIKNRKEQEFFLVSLSHILKNCSKWLQSSTKPQIDPKKKPSDPFDAFQLHSKQMLKKNSDFYSQLLDNNFLNIRCDIRLEDARKTSIHSNSVAAIITSPPYVTSYEYADIHQLTGYWYEYIENLANFRRDFIGTFYSLNQNIECKSHLGQLIVNQLLEKDPRTAKEVANYFKDMYDVGREMQRILKKGGHACLVIGNTTFKNVKIKSAEVISDLLISLGFEIIEVIKRSIPNKLIPTIRDEVTGKFSKLENENSKLVYPEEYILIAKKV